MADPYTPYNTREFDDFTLDWKIRGYLNLGLRNPLTIMSGMRTPDTRRPWSWEKFSTTLRALAVARVHCG